MNFSIKLKDPDQYVFSDGHNVWATINYEKSNSKGLVNAFGNARIEIQGEVFEIKGESLTKMLAQNTILSLFDKEKKLLSKVTIAPKQDASGATLEYNGKTYKFTLKNKLFIASSLYKWVDSNEQSVMNFKTLKGWPVMKEMSVETDLDFKTKDTLLLALWGFYLVPKNRDKRMTIIFSIFFIIAVAVFLLDFLTKLGVLR